MLKWIGTLSAVTAAAMVVFGKMKADNRSELETMASLELRKVLLYAAPPTFLAPVSSMEETAPRLRWMDKAAGR